MGEQVCGFKPGDCPNAVLTRPQFDIQNPSAPEAPEINPADLLEKLGLCDLPTGINWKSVFDNFTEQTGLIQRNAGDCPKPKGQPCKEGVHPLKPSTSRELRAGILYKGCDCEKRNGLQDQCPRSQCHGSPECLTIPPTCPPSQFSNAKHLLAKMKPLKPPKPIW